MDWQSSALDLAHAGATKILALGATFGLGGGVGIVKFLAHAPAPKLKSAWTGGVFDTLQDLVSNKERIGERRAEDGTTVYIQKATRGPGA